MSPITDRELRLVMALRRIAFEGLEEPPTMTRDDCRRIAMEGLSGWRAERLGEDAVIVTVDMDSGAVIEEQPDPMGKLLREVFG